MAFNLSSWLSNLFIPFTGFFSFLLLKLHSSTVSNYETVVFSAEICQVPFFYPLAVESFTICHYPSFNSVNVWAHSIKYAGFWIL